MNPIAEFLQHHRRPSYFLEARAVLDSVKMVWALLWTWLTGRASSEPRHIIVAPGFGADDRYTWPLRAYLRLLGHHSEGWSLGRNLAGLDIKHTFAEVPSHWNLTPPTEYSGEAGVVCLCERLRERVAARHHELGRPITLVGWSLGGYLVREVARDLPHLVDEVITLGAPVVGGPKYTSASGYFRKRGQNLDWIETEIAKREEVPIQAPITAIYSQSDAIVSWPAAIDRYSSQVDHIEVDAAHLSMVFNPTIWSHIADVLEPEI